VGAFVSRGLLQNTTMTLSTLIGPAEKILFCGHPVVFLAPSVYGIPQVRHIKTLLKRPLSKKKSKPYTLLKKLKIKIGISIFHIHKIPSSI
jgi:hypothetical protein